MMIDQGPLADRFGQFVQHGGQLRLALRLGLLEHVEERPSGGPGCVAAANCGRRRLATQDSPPRRLAGTAR